MSGHSQSFGPPTPVDFSITGCNGIELVICWRVALSTEAAVCVRQIIRYRLCAFRGDLHKTPDETGRRGRIKAEVNVLDEAGQYARAAVEIRCEGLMDTQV